MPTSATSNAQRLALFRECGLWLRGLLFLGWRYRCSCCNWPLRAFVGRGGWWHTNPDGYCPRCNSKARHRRHCLYFAGHPELFIPPLRLLEIAPWRALANSLRTRPRLTYIGLDREIAGPHISVQGDVTALPLADNSCDVVICIHVLEHVEDDRKAMRELFRVLQPGGHAIISVPLRLDQPTHEDASVTDPADRKRLFGEPEHVRYYGADLQDRLCAAGFQVAIDLAADVPEAVQRRFGLRTDENIFHCRKQTLSAD